MNPNIKVEYPRAPWLGKGKIIGTRWKGQELLIRFDRGLTMWVSRKDLKLREEQKKVKLPSSIHRYKEITPTVNKARKMVEAFRLGIVPHDEVIDFIFGREEELKKIDEGFSRLENSGGSVITIEGEYGSGKTHFLDYVYLTALEKGYAVAKTALDPIDVTPYKCKNVYRELIRSFRYRSKRTGLSNEAESDRNKNFRDFLTECAEITEVDDHRFLSPILKSIREVNHDEIIWKWIEGEPMKRWYQDKLCELRKLPTLSEFSTAVDNYCYILSGIGYLTKRVGLKGFVILIDEAETLFHLWWKTVALERGVNLFKGLALTALGELPTMLSADIKKDEWYNAYVEEIVAKLPRPYKLIHRGVKSCMTPYLYKKPSNILLVLAFTPTMLSVYRDIIETIGDKGIHISLLKLNMYQLKRMFKRLKEIYEQAFPECSSAQDRKIKSEDADYVFHKVQSFSGRSLRAFIKATIDAFDLLRHYPDELPNKLLES